MLVRILRGVLVSGTHFEAGQVVDLPSDQASVLVTMRKAETLPAAPHSPPVDFAKNVEVEAVEPSETAALTPHPKGRFTRK